MDNEIISIAFGVFVGFILFGVVNIVVDPLADVALSGASAVCESHGLVLDDFEYHRVSRVFEFVKCLESPVDSGFYFENIGGA